MKKNRTWKNRNILSQMLWCLQELMKGTCGEGLGKTTFAFPDEISLALQIFQFPASRMFSVAVLYHEFFRQESQN